MLVKNCVRQRYITIQLQYLMHVVSHDHATPVTTVTACVHEQGPEQGCRLLRIKAINFTILRAPSDKISIYGHTAHLH